METPASPPATATIRSYMLVGAEAVPVLIRAELSRRLPSTMIVGVPHASGRELAEATRSAILAAGFDYPALRVVVTVEPPCRSGIDALALPIAAAILAADLQTAWPANSVLWGGLRPDGAVVGGHAGGLAIAAAAGADVGATRGRTNLTVSGSEQLRADVNSYAPGRGYYLPTLGAIRWSLGVPADPHAGPPAQPARPVLDFADVQRPHDLIEPFLAAARQRTPILLIGSPGCGMTMLAARLPDLLPDLTRPEADEVALIRDSVGLPRAAAARPFRAPHHSISVAGLTGSRLDCRPGEVTLAHRGVLFLDEAPAFEPPVLEALAAALIQRSVRLSRGDEPPIHLPADFWLIASAPPCPCGWRGHPIRLCTCSDRQIAIHEEGLRKRPVLRDMQQIRVTVPTAGEACPRWPSSLRLRDRITAAEAADAPPG